MLKYYFEYLLYWLDNEKFKKPIKKKKPDFRFGEILYIKKGFYKDHILKVDSESIANSMIRGHIYDITGKKHITYTSMEKKYLGCIEEEEK